MSPNHPTINPPRKLPRKLPRKSQSHFGKTGQTSFPRILPRKVPRKVPMCQLPAYVGFGIITAMSDDNDFFWFLAGCAAGDQTRRLSPRNRWDVVAYAVAAVCVIVVLVIAMR